MWIRASSDGAIFSVANDLVEWKVDNSGRLYAAFDINPDLVGTVSILNSWNLIALTMSSETLSIYVNSNKDVSEEYTGTFVDVPDNQRIIGGRNSLSGYIDFISAFVWEVCLYSIVTDDFSIKGPCNLPGECLLCPDSGVCLINCDIDQGYKDGLCVDCPEQCSDSCIDDT